MENVRLARTSLPPLTLRSAYTKGRAMKHFEINVEVVSHPGNENQDNGCTRVSHASDICRTQPYKTTAARNEDKHPNIVDRKQCPKERPHICVEREAPGDNASHPPKDNEISTLCIAKQLVCAMSETWSQIGRRQDVTMGNEKKRAKRYGDCDFAHTSR